MSMMRNKKETLHFSKNVHRYAREIRDVLLFFHSLSLSQLKFISLSFSFIDAL